MPVQSDHVYVIPPGRDISVLNGVLHSLEPSQSRGLRLPIDFFFKSLADDHQQNSIGVILSGLGSDGTAGLRAIRHAAGGCFVQQPSDAQFDSMPSSAIAAGLADVVAPAQELPGKIQTFVNRVQIGVPAQVKSVAQPAEAGFVDKVVVLLRTQTGQDFSQYKKSTISRRVERRMGLHQLGREEDYLRYLRENPQECQLLFNELLSGVTSFFRDAAVWAKIKSEVMPALVASPPGGGVLRVWVPGCSTGEEAYSLAMVFKEVVEALHPEHAPTLQIFATDLNSDAVATGRAGVYARSIVADVSESRVSRFFVADPSGYKVCNEIREMVIFAEQNVILSPPFIKLDLLSCRNLLIYLDAALQAKLIQLFHYSLNPGGFLVLGCVESVGAACNLFSPLDATAQIYRRLEPPNRVLPVDSPAALVPVDEVVNPLDEPEALPANEELQTLNRELQAKVTELSRANNDMKNLLDSTEIATLFLDESLCVRRFTPKTTQVIKLIPGDAGRPVTDIVTDLIYPELVQDAKRVLRTLVFREIDVATNDARWFKVRTMPYRTQENRIDGLVMTFSDITVSKTLESELRATQKKWEALLAQAGVQGTDDGLS